MKQVMGTVGEYLAVKKSCDRQLPIKTNKGSSHEILNGCIFAYVADLPMSVLRMIAFKQAFVGTYDATMRQLLEYIAEHYGEACYHAGVYSPYNIPIPEGMDQLFYDVYPLFENAEQSWVSWDDKLDAATMTSLADAEQELALGMLSPEDFISQMDATIDSNNGR